MKNRKLNTYVEKLEEVSNQFPKIIGKKIGSYNSGRELRAIHTITGVFKDDDYYNGVFVFLLNNGKDMVMDINRLRRIFKIEKFD